MFIDIWERERELISCLLYDPWLRIEPTTFWCMGWCSNWATWPEPEKLLFKFKIQESLIQEGHLNYLDVLVGLWQETKPKCVKELQSPKHTEQYKLMYHRIWVVEVKVPIVEWPLTGNLKTQKHTGYRNWMCLHVKHRNLNCILKSKGTAETGRSPYFPESRR